MVGLAVNKAQSKDGIKLRKSPRTSENTGTLKKKRALLLFKVRVLPI